MLSVEWENPGHSTFNIRHSTFMLVGLGRFELPTSRLSGVRSNQLSYRPVRSFKSPATSPQNRLSESGNAAWADSLKTEEDRDDSRYYDSYRPRVQTFAISF